MKSSLESQMFSALDISTSRNRVALSITRIALLGVATTNLKVKFISSAWLHHDLVGETNELKSLQFSLIGFLLGADNIGVLYFSYIPWAVTGWSWLYRIFHILMYPCGVRKGIFFLQWDLLLVPCLHCTSLTGIVTRCPFFCRLIIFEPGFPLRGTFVKQLLSMEWQSCLHWHLLALEILVV